MREIKFRGFDYLKGEWIYGDLAQSFHPVPAIAYGVTMPTEFAVIIEMQYDGTDSLELFYNFVKPETVGQYTGLKDKNGAMIFEGDILEFSMHARERGSVIFRDGSFMVARNSDNCCIADFEDENGYFFEILGNIYENSELIERKENV